jgi:glycogen debranching enzyme
MAPAFATRPIRWYQRAALCAMSLLLLGACQLAPGPRTVPELDGNAAAENSGASIASLAVPVLRAENRAVSFTNKRSAYYYTQTHRNDHPEHAYFRGFNIAGRRIFSDYRISVDGQSLDPQTAAVTVRPDVLLRRYPSGVTEALRLFDDQDVVEVEVTGAATKDMTLELLGDTITPQGIEQGTDWYVAKQDAASTMADIVAVRRVANRFLIATAPTRTDAQTLLAQAVANATPWRASRAARLAAAVNGDHFLATGDAGLTNTLRWLTLTTDSLVTRQRGDGIYAGLPWFNEYWGRDSFIALPGATLVTGRFEEARAILQSFARFQELDPASRFYGRLPNIVKPGSIDYHTTDGTPRWVIALRDYVRYTGDGALVAELYPNVKASIDGALANFTDDAGYLRHADNETWMDARREPDKVSYSPRATRANDIQALWYQQLRAGVQFATQRGDAESARRWTIAADCLQSGFARDFVDPKAATVADHLDAQGARNLQLRPNVLFALDMLDDPEVAARVLRASWQALVYPWGVSTLEQADPGFHPYHLAPGHYHKDAAYHNGAVWPWLNGIAMQRMLERGQVEIAWQLFSNTNEIAATRGVVGGLPENLDAYPHPGESLPRLTGTYLQAWSNSEQLRTWYQGFLGIQPELDRGVVRVAPRLPVAFGDVEFVARIGQGALHSRYDRIDAGRRYTWRIEDVGAAIEVDIAPLTSRVFNMAPGESLVVTQRRDSVEARRRAPDGTMGPVITFANDPQRERQQDRLDAILLDTPFARPGRAEAHPVMQQSRTP